MELSEHGRRTWEDRQQDLFETALRWGVEEVAAFNLADVELKHWDGDELSAIFREVHDMRPSAPPKKLRLLNSAEMGNRQEETSNRAQVMSYRIAPKPGQREWAASEGAALCVNVEGIFEPRHKGEDYIAISHVWKEGLQADAFDRGVTRDQLRSIFQRVSHLSEWVWLDACAIPHKDDGLSEEEEKSKIDIINLLPEIYRNAKAVVILDALAMDLVSDDPLHIAIILLCGKWISRVWTYQEIKLAQKALVITGRGTVDYDTIVQGLRECNARLDHETPRERVPQARLSSWNKFRDLYRHFDMLRPHRSNRRVPLSDIAFLCRSRQTSNAVDYARALFPVLGLKWEHGWTQEDGMRKIYATNLHRHDTVCIMTMFGHKRTPFSPRWAPHSLCGLRGHIFQTPLPFSIGANDDLEGSWYEFHISRIRRFRSGNHYVFTFASGKALLCDAFFAEDEPLETIRAVEMLVQQKRCQFLTRERLTRSGTTGFVVGWSSTRERRVYLVAYVYANEELGKPRRNILVLQPQNPMMQSTTMLESVHMHNLEEQRQKDTLSAAITSSDNTSEASSTAVHTSGTPWNQRATTLSETQVLDGELQLSPDLRSNLSKERPKPGFSATGMDPSSWSREGLRDSLVKRMMKEMGYFQTENPDYMGITTIGNTLNDLLGYVRGTDGSPFEGGIFYVRFYIPFEYPLVAPICMFLTRVYHPNIDSRGRICMDRLTRNGWSPADHLGAILVSIGSMLDDPILDEPLVPEIAEHYVRDVVEYKQIARMYTESYANGVIPPLPKIRPNGEPWYADLRFG